LGGCITKPTHNISKYAEFDDNEGILITKIRTNIKDSRITIHEKDEKWPRASFSPVKAPEDLRVIKIKSGKLFFSKFFNKKDSFIFGQKNYFIIEPGTITYIGDLVVEWVVKDGGIGANILLIDREDETVAEAKEQYPWIFEKYPYRKSIQQEDTSLKMNKQF
jgi:hypothetical protein